MSTFPNCSSSEVSVVGSSVLLIDELGQIFGEKFYEANNLIIKERRFHSLPTAHPSAMFVRSRVIDAGGYRKFYDYSEDYDLWLRILEKYRLSKKWVFWK